MDELLIPIFALLCIFVLLPGMVLWFLDRQRRHRAAPMAEAGVAGNAELARLAERMEKRIETLERLLDVEAPGWRKGNAE